MIPLRDQNPTSHFPVVTVLLIALNVLAFLLWEPTFASGRTGQTEQETFFFCHAMIPYEVIHHTSLGEGGVDAQRAIANGFGESLSAARSDQKVLAQRCGHKSWLLSVFTAMFLHAGWLHIGGNMLFLWVFGNNVEDKLRPIRYLVFYLASGLVATALQVVVLHTGTNLVIPNLGASGAIAGVLGAYLFMFPRRRVLTLVIFFLITVVYIPAYVVLGAWFVLQFFNGVLAVSQRVNAGGGVAVWAHIGGFAFGGLMAWFFFPRERFGATTTPPRPDAGRGGPWTRRPRRRLPPGYGRPHGGGYPSPPGWDPPGWEPPPRPDTPG